MLPALVSQNLVLSNVNDYMEPMVTITTYMYMYAWAKIDNAKVAGLGENFVQ